MLAARQTLAVSCAAYESSGMGKFQFARCDFSAAQSRTPAAVDLYRVFDGDEYRRVMELHGYFEGKKYKAAVEGAGHSAWVVKYQGDRKAKATPLFQIAYDDRYARPLRMLIKCASTTRIADRLPQQSPSLQEDFMQRTYACRGDECGWCRNRKSLGPTTLTLLGETRKVCWYSNPDIHEFNDETVEVIREYEQMHAGLAPGKA